MLAILIIHTIFTILCFVYKVNNSISNKKPKIKNLNRNNDTGDEFWNNIVEDVAKNNTLINTKKQVLINDNANENNKPTNKLITINKELILKHKKSIIISTVAVILILILTLSLSLGLSPKIKLTDEMVVRENNTYYSCYIFKFKAENKIPATYNEYNVYCEDDYEIDFYGYSLSQQVINPNDYIYFRLMIPKNLSGKTEISILFKNKEIATRNFSY